MPIKKIDDKPKNNISKIKPVKIEKVINENDEEKNLLDCVQTLLRFHNIERSHASIRSMADVSDGPFDYKDAISSLQNMEFDSNIGKMPLRKLSDAHCPLIVELSDKKKAVLTKISQKKEYILYDKNTEENIFAQDLNIALTFKVFPTSSIDHWKWSFVGKNL